MDVEDGYMQIGMKIGRIPVYKSCVSSGARPQKECTHSHHRCLFRACLLHEPSSLSLATTPAEFLAHSAQRVHTTTMNDTTQNKQLAPTE